jgi:monoamine oxidase
LTTTIEWDPHLPEDRSKLANSLPAGSVIKSVAIYDEPFWRSDGMSGESSSTTSPIGLTIESSPPGGPGVITSFTFPPLVAEHASLAPDGRRKIVCDALAQRFGPKANTPTHFVDHDWTSEPWTKGCFASHFPPGVLTSYGRTLREPFGRVHFAGTETALAKYSYIDGAVTSGYRAADEVLNG